MTEEAILFKQKLNQYQELTDRAAYACISILKDFSEKEIAHQPASVLNAWKIGKGFIDFGKKHYPKVLLTNTEDN